MAWTYEQLFNGLSTADLNGQDSWSGDTGFDVVTGTPTPYEGAKCVKAITPADSSDHEVTRAITATTTGLVYISIFTNNAGGSDKRNFIKLMSGATIGPFVKFFASIGKILIETTGPANTEVFNGLAADTWYRLGIEFNAATDEYRVNIDGGAFSSWYVSSNSFGDIDSIVLNTNDNNSNSGGYVAWDTISPNYTPSAGGNSNFLEFMGPQPQV